ERDRQQTPRVGIGQEGGPRAAERPAGARADQLDVELGMVEVADLERAVAVPWGGQGQLPVERGRLYRGPWALALADLLGARAAIDRPSERLVARCRSALLL